MTTHSYFIDTSIFIDYLVQNDLEKSSCCAALFKRAAANTISLITTESVIVEAVSLLGSSQLYNRPRGWTQTALTRLLLLPGLKMPNQSAVIRALTLYVEKEASIQECLIAARMEQEHVRLIYSYNRNFDLFDQIKRANTAPLSD